MEQEVGFIGLGMMGGPMARRLIAQDIKLVIHDVQPEAVAEFTGLGGAAVESPAAVASRVETVLVSLPTPDVVRDVALGPGGVAEGTRVKAFVDLSTTGPNRAQEIAAGLEAKGIAAIDAPVSGGVAGARKGRRFDDHGEIADGFENQLLQPDPGAGRHLEPDQGDRLAPRSPPAYCLRESDGWLVGMRWGFARGSSNIVRWGWTGFSPLPGQEFVE